jgi:hypothetical protein
MTSPPRQLDKCFKAQGAVQVQMQWAHAKYTPPTSHSAAEKAGEADGLLIVMRQVVLKIL